MNTKHIVLFILLGIAVAIQAQAHIYIILNKEVAEGDLEKLLTLSYKEVKLGYKEVKLGAPGMMASPVTPQGATIELRYNKVMAVFSFNEESLNTTLNVKFEQDLRPKEWGYIPAGLVPLFNISNYEGDIGVVYGLHVFVVDSKPPFSIRWVNKREGKYVYNVPDIDVTRTGRSVSLSVYYFAGYRYDPNGTVVRKLGDIPRRYVRELCIYWWETTASLWRQYGYDLYPWGEECRPATRPPINITVLAINRGVEVWVDGQKFYFLNLSKPLYDYIQEIKNLSQVLPDQYLNLIVMPEYFGDSPQIGAKVLSLSTSVRGIVFTKSESEEAALKTIREDLKLGNYSIVLRRDVKINGTLISGGFDATWFYTGPYGFNFYYATSYSVITSTIPMLMGGFAPIFSFATAVFIGNETVSIPRYFYNFGGRLGGILPFLAANSYFYKKIIINNNTLNHYMVDIEPYGFRLAKRPEGIPQLFKLGGNFEVRLLDRGSVFKLPEGAFLPYSCEVGEVVTGGGVAPYYFVNYSGWMGGFKSGDLLGGALSYKRADGVFVSGDGWVGCSHYVVRVVLPNGTVVRLVAANGTSLTYTPPSPLYLSNNTRLLSPVDIRVNVTRPIQISANYTGREYLVRFVTPLGIFDRWSSYGVVVSYDGADVDFGNGTRVVVSPVRVGVTGPAVVIPNYTVYYWVGVVLPWGSSYGWQPRGSRFSFVPSQFVDLGNGTALRQPNGTCLFVVEGPGSCTITYRQRLYYVEVVSPSWRYANWTLWGDVIKIPALIDLGNGTRLVDPQPSEVVADKPMKVEVSYSRQYHVVLEGVTEWEGWVYEGGHVRLNKTMMNGVEYVPKEEALVIRGAGRLKPFYTAHFRGEFRDALGLPNNWAKASLCGKAFQADLMGRVNASVDTDSVCDVSIDKPLLGMYSVGILLLVILLVALLVLKSTRKKK